VTVGGSAAELPDVHSLLRTGSNVGVTTVVQVDDDMLQLGKSRRATGESREGDKSVVFSMGLTFNLSKAFGKCQGDNGLVPLEPEGNKGRGVLLVGNLGFGKDQSVMNPPAVGFGDISSLAGGLPAETRAKLLARNDSPLHGRGPN